jgi:hypothetical protein
MKKMVYDVQFPARIAAAVLLLACGVAGLFAQETGYASGADTELDVLSLEEMKSYSASVHSKLSGIDSPETIERNRKLEAIQNTIALQKRKVDTRHQALDKAIAEDAEPFRLLWARDMLAQEISKYDVLVKQYEDLKKQGENK